MIFTTFMTRTIKKCYVPITRSFAGHSKWHNTRFRKGRADADRSSLFSKLAESIQACIRQGGSGDDNFRLSSLIQKAREQNMPKKILEGAIARGADKNASLGQERFYEGVGPGSSSLIIQVRTDNPNRTAPNLRKIFSDYQGSMGDNGCVSWLFNNIVEFHIEESSIAFESLFELAIEVGANDVLEPVYDSSVSTECGKLFHTIICDPQDAACIHKVLEESNAKILTIDFTKLPDSFVVLEDAELENFVSLTDAFLEHPDVSAIFHNVKDIPKKIEM